MNSRLFLVFATCLKLTFWGVKAHSYAPAQLTNYDVGYGISLHMKSLTRDIFTVSSFEITHTKRLSPQDILIQLEAEISFNMDREMVVSILENEAESSLVKLAVNQAMSDISGDIKGIAIKKETITLRMGFERGVWLVKEVFEKPLSLID